MDREMDVSDVLQEDPLHFVYIIFQQRYWSRRNGVDRMIDPVRDIGRRLVATRGAA